MLEETQPQAVPGREERGGRSPSRRHRAEPIASEQRSSRAAQQPGSMAEPSAGSSETPLKVTRQLSEHAKGGSMPHVPTTPGEVQRRRVRQREMAQPDQILVPMTEDQMKVMTAEQLQAWIGSADFGRIFAPPHRGR